ncbi:extracellular solute-binding protein family 1 [Catenulispora acidiphila DSM 44928]|uniref:Extracellular solute-binding protein family 1 n=1 Tax=Catenulispora acidiphila (strain DSM 44928 / JCM 14897 / NBRC 102108 / NRRL B-24433 / ID139908) TaxID=479433 RepID=C7PZ82_CATAD|nr:extracellular solute-binding protein [Catenulispora acidiphila]ACU71539.1 extracellular solute-binding protein family 1 [Catenulispora acidiphila DSM 44928]
MNATPLNAAASRRSFLLGGLSIVGAAALSGCSVTGTSQKKGSAGSGSGTINVLFMQQAGYSTDDVTKMTAAFTKQYPDIKVNPTYVAYEALHDKIVTAAAAGTYDVVLIDVIWPAEFGKKNIVADVTSRYPADWKDTMLGGALLTADYDGKQYGVPWGMDTKFFYYNKALLAKAGVDASTLGTWSGVLQAAKALKQAKVVEYPLAWSWSQAEAIMCDYTQLVGAFGGSFTDSAGNLTLNKGGAVDALAWMRQSIVDGLTNPSSTTFLEADVEKTMNNGQAAFGLNWTYYLGSSNDPKNSQVPGQIVVAQTPAGPSGKRPGVNGAMALSVSTGSKNQDAAWKYISWIAGEDQVDQFAKDEMPIWKKSFTTPSVVSSAPDMFAVAAKQLDDLVVRPQFVNYNAVSQVIQVELQNALLGKKPAQQALDDAVKAAQPLMGG